MGLLVTNFFETRDLIGLGAFGSLNDVEFNLIAFFEALVALALNGAVVYEYVCPAITAEEAVTFCVSNHFTVPLYCANGATPLFRAVMIATREVKVLQR